MVQKSFCLLCKLVAGVTSIFWAVIWAVLVTVEENIRDDINWYLMMELKLEKEYDFFHLLLGVHLTFITMELITLFSQQYCSTVSKGVTVLVSLYNVAMTVYLFTSGEKVLSLVLFSIPITGTYLISWIWVLLLLFPLFLAIVLSFHCLSSIKRLSALTYPSPFCKYALVTSLQVVITLVTILTVHFGCQTCDHHLPSKPTFVAHRGLVQTQVENSVIAFQAAGDIESVAVVESDVQLSFDGVPFLLHDDTLVRTTSVKVTCPELDPLIDASSLHYNGPPCPLRDMTLIGDESQHIPTFSQLLQIVIKSGKALMFDLIKPPADNHPFRDQYINITLEAVVKSGVDQHKVYWLVNENRLWVRTHYPDLRQLAKTSEVSFDQFSQLGITAVNEEWTTPLKTIREAQTRNLTVFMYVINSPLFFEYFWCAGVDSVTTDYVLTLDQRDENHLHQICTSSVLSNGWLVGLLSCLFLAMGLFIICYRTRQSAK